MNGYAVFGCDDIVWCEGEEVADETADVALEYEDVACEGDFVVGAKVGFEYDVSLFGGDVVGCTEFLGTYGVFAEWIVLGVAHINAPEPVSADCAHISDDGVVGALFRSLLVS